MQLNVALSFADDQIHLLCRSREGWVDLGGCAVDVPDLEAALGALRHQAAVLLGADQPMRALVLIPPDLVRFTDAEVVVRSRRAQERYVAAALEGLTPYAVEDLAFDWIEGPAEGRVQIAAVARETLAEAEGFATSMGFAPVAFGVQAQPGLYGATAWFGPSQSAQTSGVVPRAERAVIQPIAPAPQTADLHPEDLPLFDVAHPDPSVPDPDAPQTGTPQDSAPAAQAVIPAASPSKVPDETAPDQPSEGPATDQQASAPDVPPVPDTNTADTPPEPDPGTYGLDHADVASAPEPEPEPEPEEQPDAPPAEFPTPDDAAVVVVGNDAQPRVIPAPVPLGQMPGLAPLRAVVPVTSDGPRAPQRIDPPQQFEDAQAGNDRSYSAQMVTSWHEHAQPAPPVVDPDSASGGSQGLRLGGTLPPVLASLTLPRSPGLIAVAAAVAISILGGLVWALWPAPDLPQARALGDGGQLLDQSATPDAALAAQPLAGTPATSETLTPTPPETPPQPAPDAATEAAGLAPMPNPDATGTPASSGTFLRPAGTGAASGPGVAAGMSDPAVDLAGVLGAVPALPALPPSDPPSAPQAAPPPGMVVVFTPSADVPGGLEGVRVYSGPPPVVAPPRPVPPAPPAPPADDGAQVQTDPATVETAATAQSSQPAPAGLPEQSLATEPPSEPPSEPPTDDLPVVIVTDPSQGALTTTSGLVAEVQISTAALAQQDAADPPPDPVVVTGSDLVQGPDPQAEVLVPDMPVADTVVVPLPQAETARVAALDAAQRTETEGAAQPTQAALAQGPPGADLSVADVDNTPLVGDLAADADDAAPIGAAPNPLVAEPLQPDRVASALPDPAMDPAGASGLSETTVTRTPTPTPTTATAAIDADADADVSTRAAMPLAAAAPMDATTEAVAEGAARAADQGGLDDLTAAAPVPIALADVEAAPQGDAAGAAVALVPPADMTRLRPRPRPAAATSAPSVQTSNLPAPPRPRARPAAVTQPAAAAIMARAPSPKPRPARLERGSATPTSIEGGVVSALPAVKPSAPATATVAREATYARGLDLGTTSLIGVFGTQRNRAALVRSASGRILRVQVGDDLDGGKVTAIGDEDMRYTRGGQSITLKLPRG